MSEIGTAIVAVVIAMPLAALLLWLRAAVVLTLTGWFLVPLVPGIVLPSTVLTMGILLLVGFVWHHDTPSDDDDKGPWLSMAKTAVKGVLQPLLTLALGALIRWIS